MDALIEYSQLDIYGENINAGTGYVTVNGIGKYYGSKVLTFEIRRGTIVYDSSSSWVDYDGNEHGISINVTSPDVMQSHVPSSASTVSETVAADLL